LHLFSCCILRLIAGERLVSLRAFWLQQASPIMSNDEQQAQQEKQQQLQEEEFDSPPPLESNPQVLTDYLDVL